MTEMTLEVKAPQDVIDIFPQERITGDILRGRGPRRGNLEHLIKFWRPIMRKPGGFRRCIIILANHPELYPLKPLCAWLHHETTGQWPNEGNHHAGGKLGPVLRVARRVIPGKRRRRGRKSDDCGLEIASWRLYRRWSREIKGVTTRPINGDQNAVEYKAARFMAGTKSVPVPGSFDWDENHSPRRLTVHEKVGLIRSHGRLGRTLQSMASFFIPGDMGKYRNPGRSALYGALTPGGGGGRGGGLGAGLPSISGSALRCPSGYLNGGRFADPKLSNCGGLILDAPGKGPGAITAVDRDKMKRRFQRGDDLPSVARDVVSKAPKGDPFAVVREAATKPKSKPDIRRRDSAVKDVAEYAKKNPNTTRVVRRDGVVYEPRVGPEELIKIKDHDAFKDAAWVTSKIPRSGGMAGDEVRLLTKGVKSVNYVFPEGTVKVERQGEIPAAIGAKMRTRWAAISRDPEVKVNPTLSLERWVTEFKNEVQVTYSGKIKNGNERIVVYDSVGMRKIVPRWVFQLYLSERAPRRKGGKKPHYLAKPQIEERGRRPEGKSLRPERNPYVASFVQQKALAKYVSPLPVRSWSVSQIRISHTAGLNKDSLIEMKAALFNRAAESSDISMKVFGRRRRRGLGRISSFARRMPKVVPYDRHARDGDNDGIVQEGTIWERPAGAVFRGIAQGARRLVSSGILENDRGHRIDYKPGDHERSPLRQMSRRQVRRAGRVDRIAVGQEGRIGERDRRLIAEGEAVDRGEVDESVDRVRRRVLRAMGSPERRRRRAGRQRERADRDVARAQSDIERAGELRRLREERDAFDREVAELDERHREEREGLMERDPRQRDRRQRRRGEPEAEEEEAEPARDRTGPLERFARGREGAIRRRDEREGAEVDFSERDRRREERRERRAARLDRFAEGQDEAIADRDRAEQAAVDREEVDGIINRITRPLRRLFEERGFNERREEDDEEVRERTGHSVGEHINALEGRDATILDPTPEEEARDVQDLIEAVRVQEDGSLPDDRSLRNVGNRFPQRGLPERAFWRDDDYEPGGGRDAVEQREHHERRFGRYFDEDGNINDRGQLVNRLLEKQREGADEKDDRLSVEQIQKLVQRIEDPNLAEERNLEAQRPRWEARESLVLAAEDLIAREEWDDDMRAEAALLMDHMPPPLPDDDENPGPYARLRRRYHQERPTRSPDTPDAPERPRPPGRIEQLENDAQAAMDRGENIDKVMGIRYPDRPEDMTPENIQREMAEIDAAFPDFMDRDFLVGRRYEELEAGRRGEGEGPQGPTPQNETPEIDVPDAPNTAEARIAAVSDAERPAQRAVERIRERIVEQLGEEALQQIFNDWPDVEAQHGRDHAGSQLLYPIRTAVDWHRPQEVNVDDPAGILLGEEIWGDNPPDVPSDAGLDEILVAVRERLAVDGEGQTEGLAILRTRLEGIAGGGVQGHDYRVDWNDLGVRRRREWEEAGNPASGELLEERVLTQMLRHLQQIGNQPDGQRDMVQEITSILDNWDRDAIRRANPANEPNVPDADLPWLQAVSQRIMGRRMNKIRAVSGERSARHGRPARFGLEEFGLEREWFGEGHNLTAERKTKIKELITEAYSLGVENRFTAPGSPDAEFMISTNASGGVPDISINKSGGTTTTGFSANIFVRRKNADGSWGDWVSSGSTSRTVYLKADGTGHINNGTMYNSGAKGLGFATVYNNYAWASLVETGLIRHVHVGPASDGPVIWGRHGFDDRSAAKGMTHFLAIEVSKFDAGLESVLLSESMRDEAERLVGAYHRDPANVTSMLGHSVLQSEGRHPWERLAVDGSPLGEDQFPGAMGTKYGQWWVQRETVDGQRYSPATGSSDFVISESELARIFHETIASIRVDQGQLPEANRPRPPTVDNNAALPSSLDAIAAMSHQDMWAEMASMRSRWNDRALMNMPDEIRERYEALVEAYDRAAPAGARRPEPLGRALDRPQNMDSGGWSTAARRQWRLDNPDGETPPWLA